MFIKQYLKRILHLKDEMSGNAFSEMWDFVKEDESWEDE